MSKNPRKTKSHRCETPQCKNTAWETDKGDGRWYCEACFDAWDADRSPEKDASITDTTSATIESLDIGEGWRRANNTQNNPAAPLIGFSETNGRCLVTLQRHYPFIVYLGFSLWRKLIVMMNGDIEPQDWELTRPPLVLPKAVVATSSDGSSREEGSEYESEDGPKDSKACHIGVLGDLRAAWKEEFIAHEAGASRPKLELGEDNKIFLCWLVRTQQLDALDALLKFYELDWEDTWGDSDYESVPLLHFACSNEFMGTGHLSLKMVNLLLTHGAEVTMEDNREATALHHFAAGACIDEDTDPEVRRVTISVGERLLSLGADLEARNNQGWTPLMQACFVCNADAAEFLISKGADAASIERDGCGTLRMALQGRSEETKELPRLVAMLVKHGAIDNNRSKYVPNRTALHCVAMNFKSAAVVQTLLEEGGSVLEAQDFLGNTALHLAADARQVEKIQLLVAKFGANINARNNDGNTPLHYATRSAMDPPCDFGYDADAAVQRLIELGANTDVLNNKGESPKKYAASGSSNSI